MDPQYRLRTIDFVDAQSPASADVDFTQAKHVKRVRTNSVSSNGSEQSEVSFAVPVKNLYDCLSDSSASTVLEERSNNNVITAKQGKKTANHLYLSC